MASYLLKEDLKTHLYDEIVNEIVRDESGEDDITTNAIAAAIAEAKSYLNKYNLSKLFDPDADDYVADANLKNKVKDLACWHIIALANPNINYEVFHERYEKAVRWFEFIMKGQLDPDGWPYKTDDADTDYNEGGTISYLTNPKRTNSF